MTNGSLETLHNYKNNHKKRNNTFHCLREYVIVGMPISRLHSVLHIHIYSRYRVLPRIVQINILFDKVLHRLTLQCIHSSKLFLTYPNDFENGI